MQPSTLDSGLSDEYLEESECESGLLQSTEGETEAARLGRSVRMEGTERHSVRALSLPFREWGTDFEKLFVPSTVVVVRASAFKKSNLREIVFGEHSQVRSIQRDAFSHCDKLGAIFIPASVELLGAGCFDSGFPGSHLEILFSEHANLKVIGTGCFTTTLISQIVIPASVEALGTMCFAHCARLWEVKFSEHSNLKKIEIECFAGSRLSRIVVSKDVEFMHGSSLTGLDGICLCSENPHFVYENEFLLTSDRKRLVRNFRRDGTIFIPDFIELLDDSCFYECKSLREVTFSENSNVKAIGSECFDSSGLSRIVIPASVQSIDSSCFADCLLLSEVIFFENCNLTRIENGCFIDSSALTQIVIPASVRYLGENCFDGCESLSEVIFSENSALKSLPEECFRLSGLTRIVIPASVEFLGKNCFDECKSLSEVIFTENSKLKWIGENCFDGTGLHRIVLPASVEWNPDPGIEVERMPPRSS